MGQDKALLPFGDKTLLEYLIEWMRPVFDETLVIVDQKSKLQGLDLQGVKVYEDWIREQGPLAGIYTGLCFSKTRANCIFTCDMPWVDQDLIEELIEFWEKDIDVVCLEDPKGKLQPFPGIYDRQCRYLIRLALEEGETSVQDFLRVVTIKPLVLTQEKIHLLTNMNTIEDYYGALKEKEKKEELKNETNFIASE